MRTQPYFRASGDHDYSGAPPASGNARPNPDEVMSTALWAFIAVATSLFFLFIVSYLMRMQSTDWHAITMPRQLWLSTALLFAASAAIHSTNIAARRGHWRVLRKLLLTAGLCMIAFLFIQSLAWQALLASRITATGNPAGSYFYLLTAMHGLHVAGGIVAWLLVSRPLWRRKQKGMAVPRARPIRLCARYWDFLLLVWLALFATMGGLTNEVVQFICGSA
jgi:cytochrome c oxidase subunit III